MEQPKKNFKIVSDKKARMILPNAINFNWCLHRFELNKICIRWKI